jgi:hypothetical protein
MRELMLFMGGAIAGMGLTLGVFVMAYAHGLALPSQADDGKAMLGCMIISVSCGVAALTLGASRRV